MIFPLFCRSRSLYHVRFLLRVIFTFQPATCTKSVTLRIDGQTVNMLQGRKVTANGRDITLPYEKPGIKATTLSGSAIQGKKKSLLKLE